MDVVIRRWCERDDLVELTNLVHRAYKVLADQGLYYLGTHQPVEKTAERMEHGETWVATVDGRLVGSVIVYPPGYMSGCAYYKNFGPAVFGQFAVDPDFQGVGIGKLLLAQVEVVSRDAGATVLACDTSEKALALIEMYKKWGFEIVGDADWRPDVNYKSVILARAILPSGPEI